MIQYLCDRCGIVLNDRDGFIQIDYCTTDRGETDLQRHYISGTEHKGTIHLCGECKNGLVRFMKECKNGKRFF